MKKNILALSCLTLLLLLLLVFPGFGQKKEITWSTKSEAAKKLAIQGEVHMLNLESPQAYEHFKAALDLDPDFTIPLVFMTAMTVGQTRKNYIERALKSADNKTAGEKLLASTLAPGVTAVAYGQIWSDLNNMFPDDPMIGANYIYTRPSQQQQLIASQSFIKKFPKEPCMYNLAAFLTLQIKKDTAAAKALFEKYIELYPGGCNPYDSMGEFYFMTGDMAKSEKYYMMALEKYPFNSSSIDKLKEIQAKK